MLFTSLRAMNEAHRILLQARMAETGESYPILLQGDKSRTDLLDEFRRLGNAVLLGSQSFWEGVDVAGDALVPGGHRPPAVPAAGRSGPGRAHGRDEAGRQEPVLRLSVAARRDQPEAGRRPADPARDGSRRVDDLRPALVEKPYGRSIWQALPPMRRSRVREEASAFLRGWGVASPSG
jgi:ATP-dependent DNA helicase DinG